MLEDLGTRPEYAAAAAAARSMALDGARVAELGAVAAVALVAAESQGVPLQRISATVRLLHENPARAAAKARARRERRGLAAAALAAAVSATALGSAAAAVRAWRPRPSP